MNGVQRPSDRITAHTDLLVSAVAVVDRLDDIDVVAEIGGPMDELAALLTDIRTVEAIRALRDHDADLARVADMLAQSSTIGWRQAWLIRHTGIDLLDAEMIAHLDHDRFRRLAALDTRLGVLDPLLDAATTAADTLTRALDRHTDPGALSALVPDTIPEEWTR